MKPAPAKLFLWSDVSFSSASARGSAGSDVVSPEDTPDEVVSAADVSGADVTIAEVSSVSGLFITMNPQDSRDMSAAASRGRTR